MSVRLLRGLYIPILLLVNISPVRAQLENRIFDQSDSVSASDTHVFKLHLELLNYYRNTEYFDLIEKGQTFFGSMFQAHVSYQPYEKVLLKAGLQTRQDYGSTGFVAVQPVLSLSIFHGKWRYNLGMLQGTTNYGYIEPLYNIDRAITHRIENGMQGIYTSRNFTFNNYLVWNEPTYRTTTNQERFTTGFTANSVIISGEHGKLSFPFQGTLAHRGGQLNGNPTPIFSRVNTSVGIRYKYRSVSGFTIGTEHHWLCSVDFSPTITQPYKNGDASWHTLSASFKGFELMFHYWAGREWQSPVGTQIYNNYNLYDVYALRQVRHMMMSRIMYTKQIQKNLMIDLRLEPFYDQEYRQFQYSYSIYARINLSNRLGRINLNN